MKVLAGACKGGPWDGKRFAHNAETKEFFEPRMTFALFNDPEIVQAKLGEYYWGKNGLWIWLPEGTTSKRVPRAHR